MGTSARPVGDTTTVVHTIENQTFPTLVANVSSSTAPSTTTPSTTTATTVTTIETTTTTTTTQAPDDHAAAIACGVIFGIIGAALVVVGVIFLLRWLKGRRSKSSDGDNYENVMASPPEPVMEGDASYYAKLDKTKSIHHYGKFNDNTVSQPQPGPNQLYSNQEPNSGQYSNVTAAKPPTNAKKALRPGQGQNSEPYESMDIAMQTLAADGNRDSQFYEKITPGTHDIFSNKSDVLSNSDTSQNPKKHFPRVSGDPGYVNTTEDDEQAAATVSRTSCEMPNSNIGEELPSLDTTDSEYVNTTTIDEIVAVGNASKDNLNEKDNRTRT